MSWWSSKIAMPQGLTVKVSSQRLSLAKSKPPETPYPNSKALRAGKFPILESKRKDQGMRPVKMEPPSWSNKALPVCSLRLPRGVVQALLRVTNLAQPEISNKNQLLTSNKCSIVTISLSSLQSRTLEPAILWPRAPTPLFIIKHSLLPSKLPELMAKLQILSPERYAI